MKERFVQHPSLNKRIACSEMCKYCGAVNGLRCSSRKDFPEHLTGFSGCLAANGQYIPMNSDVNYEIY